MTRFFKAIFFSVVLISWAGGVFAHHSFAMYDSSKTYSFTGVVTRISPDAGHLKIYFAPLNDTRDSVIRDESGEPVIWSVEMEGAAKSAREGVSVNSFPRGSIISVGLHPLRNGQPGGGRGLSGLYKCPAETPPAIGMHCDSVEGSTSHGEGIMLEPTGVWSVSNN